MNINNGGLGFIQTLDNAPFQKALKQSFDSVNNFSAKSVMSMDAVQVKMNDLIGLSAGFLSVQGAKNFIQEMVKVRGEFEQTEIAFTTMLQSQEKSKKLMAEMVELAKNTPMQFSEVSQGAKQLLAYQVEAENLTDTLTMLGNISSGLSVPLSRLILVYGQVKAKGKLMGDDLRQFTEAGVPMIAAIAKNMGVAQSAVAEMVSEGKVGFKEVEKVLQDMTSQGGLFFNMMEEQSKTIPGQIAKLQDELEQVFNTLGKEATPVITAVLSGTATLVENYDKLLRVLAVAITTYGTYKTAIMVATIAQNSHTIATNLASGAWKVLNTTMGKNPIAVVLTLVAGLVASLVDLEDVLGKANIEFSGISAEMETSTEHQRQFSKSLAETKSKIDPLISVIKDETSSLNTRKRAYEDLIKIHPEFTDTLDNEYKATVKLDGAYKNLIKRLDEAALARAREAVRQKRAQNLADAEAIEYDAKLRADAEIKANEKIAKENKKLAEKYAEDLKSSTRESVEMSYVPKATVTVAQKAFENAKENVEKAKKELDDFSEYSKKWYKDLENENNNNDDGGGSGGGNGKAKTKTKKADDPVEIYKKEISQIKEQYENYNKWVDTNDRFLLTQAHALGATLKFKGETYLDFLRKQAEELRKSATHSETARKQLYFINQELQQQIDFSEIEEYKKGIEKQIDSAKSLLEVTELIQMAKAGLEGKTDQSSVDKMEFLDSKDLDTAEKLKDAIQSVIDNNRSEMQEMNAMFDEYYRDLQYLNQALTEAFKIEDKERIESLQTAIEERTKKFSKATEGMTGDADYTELIKNHQSYADKIAKIEEKMRKDIETAQSNNDYSIIPQIEKQAKDETSKILKEQLMGSEEWANLFADMDNMSVSQLDVLIKEIETKLQGLEGEFNPIDLASIKKQLQQAKSLILDKNPFYELGNSLKDAFSNGTNGVEDNFQEVVTKWNRVGDAVDGSFDFINKAIESSDFLKKALGEAGQAAIQSVQTAVSAAIAIVATVKAAKAAVTSLEKASVILAIISTALQVAQAIASILTNIFSKDKKRQKEINKHQEAVDALTDSYKDLENAVKSALGSDVYSGQKQMIDNLIKQQAEYQKMINAEKSKKKSDSGKIKEWEDAMRDAKQTIDDLLKEIADDVLQTTAKDLADELGDALVSAFSQGEDAAKSFEKVVEDVLRNAVLNQLKKQFLEKQLQQALDQLYRDMGGDDQGNFNWNGLTPEEQQAFRDKMREISENFTGMLGAYSDLFQDIVDPNESALAGAIKGVSEETANALLGQMNAIRILQVESIDLKRNSNAILVQQLDQLFRIEYNTRNIVPMLREIKSAIEDSDDSARAWGH